MVVNQTAGGKGPKQQFEKQRENLRVAEDRSAELPKELAETKELNRGLAIENSRLTLLAKRLEQTIAVLEAGAVPLCSGPARSGDAPT
jgi:uncharacterized protein involved in exopolysaccharide biosynthesis